MDDVEVLFAALGPINPGLANFNQVANLTGQFDTRFSGTRPFDVWQFQTTFTKILSPMMGADSGVLLWEGAVTHVPDLPEKDVLRFEGPGTYVSGNPILGPVAHAGKPIEDPSRFEKSRRVGAYLGLRPKSRSSGERDPELRISKAGDHLLRRHLVQCAQYILGPLAQDSDLRRWGLRLAGRGGKNAKKRAVVAVARKLAVLLHRLWVTGEVYEPLRQAEAA